MSEFTPVTKCPKCREVVLQYRPEVDLDQDLVCSGCSATPKANQLVTSTGKTILDIGADLAKQAFSGIKGFKPSR
jgi:hypothetical protein